jgi:hypothetical protein
MKPVNNWHAYMAVTNPVAKLRFLNVIRPISMENPEPCKEQVSAVGGGRSTGRGALWQHLLTCFFSGCQIAAGRLSGESFIQMLTSG